MESRAVSYIFSMFPQILPQLDPILWMGKLRAEGGGDPPSLVTLQ